MVQQTETAQYFGCLVEVWKSPEPRHPAPWRFAVSHQGQRHEFIGVPNQCETKRKALKRAWWRAKWLATGEWSKHYGKAHNATDPLDAGE